VPATARSLADDLRRRGDDDLADLLVRRPDLARPAPADVTTLAARATTRASVQRALDALDLAHLQTLEAVTVTGAARPAQVARLLGQRARSARVARLVGDLCDLALTWRSPEGASAARTVQEVIGDPAGLGPATDSAPTGAALTAALRALDDSQRAVLQALTWGPPTGVLSAGGSGDRAVGEAGRALVEAGLLRRVDDSHVVLPRQVALALRDGRLHREPALDPPAAPSTLLDPGVVDATVGARTAELLALVAELLDEWGARPPRVLRSGGLSVRDLGRAAALVEVTAAEAAWALEVMLAAGLIAADDSGEPAWMPTGESDDWSDRAAGERWALLAGAWLTMPAAPSLVGQQDGTRVNALSLQTSWPAGRQRRSDALAALATLPVGSAPAERDLVELLRWRHPIRMSRVGDGQAAVTTVLREAEWAGVTGRGALGSPGRSLLEADRHRAARSMDEHVPAAVDHVLVQADLTAVAPGRLDGPARAVMRLVGDVESRGGATVHRIGERSIRRALDTGWSADQILAEIAGISRTGVPQPLDYLVRDVARRHGVARVGSVAAYLRSDDEALVDRMLADRSLALLQLRRIAATVLVSPVGAGTVLDVLRERQYGPVVEGGDGGIALAPARHHRTSRRAGSSVQVRTVDADIAARIVEGMRRGEQARGQVAGERRGGPPSATDPVVTAALLREAAADGAPVWIGYADDAGGVQPLLLRPTVVEGGRVRGTVADQDLPRTFLLHRISGARPAE
jgi:hypothetical protein